MYQTYKPSGKVSGLLFPLLLFMLFIITPVMGIITGIAWVYSPSILLNTIVLAISIYFVAVWGADCCIRKGRVRNPFIAIICSILVVASFFLTFFYCYAVILKKLSENILQAFLILKESGIAISTIKAGYLFTLKNEFFIGAVIIVILIALVFVLLNFFYQSSLPFCEKTKQWAQEFSLTMKYIEDADQFLKKIAFRDYTQLMELEQLQEVNCSHSKLELFALEENNRFFVTIENQKQKKGERNKDGTPKFEEQEIIKYLSVDAQTGRVLLSKTKNSDVEATAMVLTQGDIKNKKIKLFQMILFSVVQIGVLVYALFNMENAKEFFSNKMVLFYLIATFLIWVMNFVTAFIKQDVMIKDENSLYFNETKRYQTEKNSEPLGYKLYYFVMIIISIAMFVYYVMNMYGHNL